MAEVISVNTGRAREAAWTTAGRTAIDKRPVEGPVFVRFTGLDGDGRGDVANHGTPDHAVYAYAREDLDLWAARLGRPLRDGMFGENLTTLGADLSGARMGDRWRIGTVLLELTGPRVPCGTFRAWMDEQGWVKRFTEEGRTGAYFQVVEEGSLAAGDSMELLDRNDAAVTVLEAFHAFNGDHDLLRRILALPGHPPIWQAIAEHRGVL